MEVASEWVFKFLRESFGSTFCPVPLSEAKIVLDGGVGLPYKFGNYVYKSDFLEKCPNFLDNIDFSSRSDYSMMWDCFPKVEILKKEKALEKTRIICGAPVEHYLVGAMLFTEMNNAFSVGRLDSKIALGIRNSYRGWNALYEFLPEYCENSDCAAFDKRVSPKLLKFVYLIKERLMLLTPEQKTQFWWYFNNLVFRRSYLGNGSVYNVCGGNGSGQYNTTVDNTIAHLILIAYSHVCINNSYEDFVRSKQLVFGDDYIGEPMPANFWRWFSTSGIVIKKSVIQLKDKCDFLSSLFKQTAYGVACIPKSAKGILSAITSESKKWRTFREQKLYSLWLNYYYSDYSKLFSDMLTHCGIKFNYRDAHDYHFGWIGGFKSDKHEQFS